MNKKNYINSNDKSNNYQNETSNGGNNIVLSSRNFNKEENYNSNIRVNKNNFIK